MYQPSNTTKIKVVPLILYISMVAHKFVFNRIVSAEPYDGTCMLEVSVIVNLSVENVYC